MSASANRRGGRRSAPDAIQSIAMDRNPVKRQTQPENTRCRALLLAGGGALVLTCIGLTLLSPRFDPGHAESRLPIIGVVLLLTAAGALYFAVACISLKTRFSRGLRRWVLGVGLIMRLATLPSTPILEDDHFRYLWDGAVTAHGISPYRYAPSDIRISSSHRVPADLKALAESSGGIVERINYPWLRTIYPPLAQAAFAAAHLVAPWSLTSWRLLLAFFDVATLWLIVRLGLPAAAVLIYWWNPLLVKEIYNSGHLDMLMLPFLLLAAAAVCRKRSIAATAALGIAAGIKLWPFVLMPIIWRRLVRRPAALVVSLSMAAAAAGLLLLPFVGSGLDRSSGLVAYSRYWEMNDGLYMVIRWVVLQVLEILDAGTVGGQLAPRAAVAVIAAAVSLWAAKDPAADPPGRFLAVTCTLFLLSPTQFPWYYLWMLPFLAWRPQPALLLYTALLPLYYLRPYLKLAGNTRLFDQVLVWLQHAPVLVLLGWHWLQRSKRPHGPDCRS